MRRPRPGHSPACTAADAVKWLRDTHDWNLSTNRTLPKTQLRSSRDYGLLVEDRELAAFMQQHDQDSGDGGQNFDLGRPVRDVSGALRKLTGQNTDDAETEQLVPDANAALLFITREGSLSLIETTDRVRQTQRLNGLAGAPPADVGFFLGVRYILKSIVP